MQIGTYDDGSPVELHTKSLIGFNTALMALPGGGKSGLARVLLETTFGHFPHVVLDPDNEFGTLRERFEYLVAGGDDADAPATLGNAAALARMVLEHRVSMVIQLNHLRDDGPQLFVDAFLREVMEAPKEQWRPLLIVLDEAQRFIPESRTTEASLAVADVMARGRKRGIGFVLASQRISFVSKAATELCQNWFLGIAGLGNDLDRTCKMLGFSAKSAAGRAITEMPPRTFWAYGPAIGRVPHRLFVADAVTSIPQIGEAAPPTPPAPKALEKLLGALRKAATPSTPTPAEKPGAPVGALSGPARDAIFEEGRVVGFAAGHDSGRRHAFGLARDALKYAMVPLLQWVDAKADGADPETGEIDPAAFDRGVETATKLWAESDEQPPEASRPARREPVEGAPVLKAAAQTILDTLAWFEAMGLPSIDKGTLAGMMGVSPTSGAYSQNLAGLKAMGYVDYPGGGLVMLTEAGQEIAIAPERPATNRVVQEGFASKLSAAAARLMWALVESHPESVGKTELATELSISPTSGAYSQNLATLRGLGLIDYPAPGKVVATKLLFPFQERKRR